LLPEVDLGKQRPGRLHEVRLPLDADDLVGELRQDHDEPTVTAADLECAPQLRLPRDLRQALADDAMVEVGDGVADRTLGRNILDGKHEPRAQPLPLPHAVPRAARMAQDEPQLLDAHADSPRFLMNRAGTPPTIVYGSTSPTTTAPAATTAPCPTRTPPATVTLPPIHTSASTA